MNPNFKQNLTCICLGLAVCSGLAICAPLEAHALPAQAQSATAQQITVTGVVYDGEGPCIGATVAQKDKLSNATMTDVEGKFSIKVPAGSIIQVSYIGCQPKEVKAESGRELEIYLESDDVTLGEVVVVGFGTQKKVNLTGAVGIATGEELKDRPVRNAA